MKISKRTREEAILILDIATSHAESGDHWLSVWDVAEGIGSHNLSAQAAWHAYGMTTATSAQARGDAAGLLRDGWSPGDPVVLL